MQNIVKTTLVQSSVPKKKSVLGMTLVELMASMGIAVAVIVGALALYNQASDTQKSTQMVSDIDALRSASKMMYSGQGNYTGLNNGLLISAGKVPSSLRTNTASGATDITSRDGYGIVVSASATSGQFTITLNGSPATLCKDIATKFTGYVSLTIGTTANTTLPLTPVQAEAQCVADGTTMVWTSR